METLGRIVFAVLGIVGLIVLLWLSIYLFLALLLIGGGVFAFFYLRDLLLEKGILNPTPGQPYVETVDEGIVIEGDYTPVGIEEKKE